MASAQVVETSVNTNNSPSQDYTTNPDDHSNHWVQTFHCYTAHISNFHDTQCSPFPTNLSAILKVT